MAVDLEDTSDGADTASSAQQQPEADIKVVEERPGGEQDTRYDESAAEERHRAIGKPFFKPEQNDNNSRLMQGIWLDEFNMLKFPKSHIYVSHKALKENNFQIFKSNIICIKLIFPR